MPAQGCALATLGKRIPFLEGATLKELRQAFVNRKAPQPLRGCENLPIVFNPEFQTKPWADILPTLSALLDS